MASMSTMVGSLRSRVRLGLQGVDTDPLKMYTDSFLTDLVTGAIFTHDPSLVLDTLPDNQIQFVMWLSMIDVYYAMSADTAWLYAIEGSGAKLNRDELFDHLIKLASQLQDKYDKAWAKFYSQSLELDSSDVLIEARYTPRSNRLVQPPTISLSVIGQTPSSIDLMWTRVADRQIDGYKIYQSSQEIIYEFSDLDNLIDTNAVSVFWEPRDTWKTKYRVLNLIPGNTYFFCVFVRDMYSHKCWSEISITQPTTSGVINTVLSTNNSDVNSVN